QPPVRQPPVQQPAAAYPPPQPMAPPAAMPPQPPASPPRVTLDKGRVSLRKRETVSLVKAGRPLLSRVRMALGWDPAPGRGNIDLDASCIAFDASRRKLELVWFMHKAAYNGAILHSGDNLTGAGEGDDESISIDLGQLPAEVHAVVFTVNSFTGQKFTDVARAYCRLVDESNQAELVRFDLSESEPRRGVLMCKLVREGEAWSMTALGEFADGRTVKKMVDPAAALL
ncbi:TerD family protein, partial [Mangrovactinospora gilvigrisea]|uniref:TerD family protein n=1 Tax=Mangrovactinospora gilvigrisea TaxID=1428644 RepID=UPI000A71B6F2